MSKYLNLDSIDLVQELVKCTLDTSTFNPDEWSIWEGESLIKIGKMIIREIKAKEIESLCKKI